MRPILIYGTSGFAREVHTLIQDINRQTPSWDVRGFLTDNETSWGQTIRGIPVLGGQDWLERGTERPCLALGIGSPAVKHKLAVALEDMVEAFPQLIHPNVVISEHVVLGKGVIITAGNILTTEIVLGNFSMLNLMCTVGHDSSIGPYASVMPGVNISGNVHVGEGCEIGTGSKIIQGRRIGAWSVVGAGSVITKDLPANCTAVGVPAKPIKERTPGWHLA